MANQEFTHYPSTYHNTNQQNHNKASNNIRTNIRAYVTTPLGPADLPLPILENVSDKCATDVPANARIDNPPTGVTIIVTQDGNILNYNPVDSSFTYFNSVGTPVGTHQIVVKFDNGSISSEKDTAYVVSGLTVPVFNFGNLDSICAGAAVPVLGAASANGITGTWYPQAIDNQNSAVYTFTPSGGQCSIPIHFSVTVNLTLTPAVTIRAASTSLCQGDATSFMASVVNDGAGNVEWKLNGNNAGTG